MDKLSVYKKYFETALDSTSLVMHRGYVLKLISMVEELQETNKSLQRMVEEGLTFEDVYNADDEINPQSR